MECSEGRETMAFCRTRSSLHQAADLEYLYVSTSTFTIALFEIAVAVGLGFVIGCSISGGVV
jgi:hypothetical protein